MIAFHIVVPYDADSAAIREKIRETLGSFFDPEACYSVFRSCLLPYSGGDTLPKRLRIHAQLTEKAEQILCRKETRFQPAEAFGYSAPASKLKERPVVIGSGPAGLFAALILAEAGSEPIVLERGDTVDERIRHVRHFHLTGEIDPESNIQFGEGGAGAFSDGKLKTGCLNARSYKVLSTFVEAGAPDEILLREDAHIGTDLLPGILRNIRNRIVSLGGEFRFRCRAEGFLTGTDGIYGVKTSQGDLACRRVILATGHSARDTYCVLRDMGIPFAAKPFGIGVRIEHPQSLADTWAYGPFAGRPDLEPAPYHLVTHLPNGHSVYSFCMCPGGTVVAAASDPDGLVTNGMSTFARDSGIANSALLVSVNPSDLEQQDPFSGLAFQKYWERKAFEAGGGGHVAVGQRLGDFLPGHASNRFGSIVPTYPRGCVPGKLDAALPRFALESLREAVADFDRRLPGYLCEDAWMTGTETRSTSPLRILRAENGQALGLPGLYPCGEGAGYSGGIVSSAVDGIRCAESVLESPDTD